MTADRDRIAALETAVRAMPQMREHIRTLVGVTVNHEKRLKQCIAGLNQTRALVEQVQLDLDKLRLEVGCD